MTLFFFTFLTRVLFPQFLITFCKNFLSDSSAITRSFRTVNGISLCGVATPNCQFGDIPDFRDWKIRVTSFSHAIYGDNMQRELPGPSHMHRIAVVALHRHSENFIVGRSSMTNAPNYRSLMSRTKSIVLPIHVGDCTESDGRREKGKGDSQEKGAGYRMDAIIVYVGR